MNLLSSKRSGRTTAKLGLVLAGTTALVTMGMAGPAAAIHDGEAHAEASAANGTGIFDPVAQLLETTGCEADFINGGPETTTGFCTSSIEANPTQDITRFATANVAGSGAATSSAQGGVADVNVIDLPQELNIQALLTSLAATDSGASAIGPILQALGQVGNAILGAALAPLLDTLLDPILTAFDNSLPLSLELGAVLARCSATATTATAESDVADLSLLVDIPNVQNIPVVFQTPVTGHSDLVMDAPQQLVDGILNGLRTSLLNAGGLLTPILTLLNGIVTNLQLQVIDPLLETLRPTLLSGLSQLLDPIVNGEVNHVTTPTASNDHTFQNLQAGPWSAPDEIALTALSLTVLGSNTLNLGMVHCGDNVAGTPDGPTATPTPRDRDDNDDSDDSDDGGDDDDDDSPKSINSGISGGDLSAAGLAGLLAMTAMGGSVARRRFNA